MNTSECFQQLRPGQVHVWFASIDRTRAEIRDFERSLSLKETDRAGRFRKICDREHYVVRQGILRRLLSQYLSCEAPNVEIHQDINGKPYLTRPKNEAAIQFNVSHSDGIAVYAFGLIDSIGVDIEKIREFPDMLEMVEEHFTQREKYQILSCPTEQRLMLFYRFWTRKEAVLKAQGEGLLRGLDSVEVARGETGGGKVRFTDQTIAEEYFLVDIEAPIGFCAALGVANRTTEIFFPVNRT